MKIAKFIGNKALIESKDLLILISLTHPKNFFPIKLLIH